MTALFLGVISLVVACAHDRDKDEEQGEARDQEPAQDPASLAEVACVEPSDPPVLTCKLDAKPQYRTGEPIEVEFVLTNSSKQDHYLLDWLTPLEGFRGKIFTLRRDDGSELRYEGILVKRGDPSAAAYHHIAPGESVRAAVDLTEVFDFTEVFDAGAPATYTLEFRNMLHDLVEIVGGGAALPPRPRDQHCHHSLACDPISFEVVPGDRAQVPLIRRDAVDQREPAALDQVTVSSVPLCTTPQVALAPKYHSCSASQEATIYAAHMTANIFTWASAVQLERVPPDANNDNYEYQYWFGEYTEGHAAAVGVNYTNVYQALGAHRYTYNCAPAACEPSYYAYTYFGSRTIYLCQQFWQAPIYGSDSQQGTVIHELTHAVCDTDDYTYGASSSHELAMDQPNLAVSNADNYEEFAENIATCSAMMSDLPSIGVNNACRFSGSPGDALDIVVNFQQDGNNYVYFQNMGTEACKMTAGSGSTGWIVDEDIYIVAPSSSPATTEGYRYASCGSGTYKWSVVATDDQTDGPQCNLIVFVPTDN